MNIVKSTALFLTAIHATNAGLRGATRELAASETDPEPERGPYHYKLSQAKWGELQSQDQVSRSHLTIWVSIYNLQ